MSSSCISVHCLLPAATKYDFSTILRCSTAQQRPHEAVLRCHCVISSYLGRFGRCRTSLERRRQRYRSLRFAGTMGCRRTNPRGGQRAQLEDSRIGQLRKVWEATQKGRLADFEIEKLRIASLERIIILCGGTLTLSYTAAVNFRSHIPTGGVSQLTDLLMAWKLLIAAIVIALASIFFTILGSDHSNVWNTYNSTNLEIEFSRADQSEPSPFAKNRDRAERSRKLHERFSFIAKCGALAAQITTCISYVFLYLFAKASLFVN